MKKISKVGKALKIAVALFVSRAIFKTKNKAEIAPQNKQASNKPTSPMKSSLEGLPKRKRDELQHAVEIIRKEVNPEMIILFGSYARGDWVEEYGPDKYHFKYQSDFDIYVLVKSKKLARKVSRWKKLRDILRREISTPVELLADNIGYFNHCLSAGQYFYTDIKNEGILLYDSKQFQLEEAYKLSIEERRKKAEKNFKNWYKSADESVKHYYYALNDGDYLKAAFELHQATEHFYSTLLLVFTDYRPKKHDIEELGKRVSSQDPIFLTVFSRASGEEQRRFELLQKAYIDSRYNRENYVVTKEDLEWLAEEVKKLQKLTEEACKKKIDSFEAQSDSEQKAKSNNESEQN
jgi:HEPN domain-containing protein/predicted nucleotidyltransferase